jgi:hypothetical protein
MQLRISRALQIILNTSVALYSGGRLRFDWLHNINHDQTLAAILVGCFILNGVIALTNKRCLFKVVETKASVVLEPNTPVSATSSSRKGAQLHTTGRSLEMCGGKLIPDTKYIPPVDEIMTFTRTTKHFDMGGNEKGYSEEEYEAPGHISGYCSTISGEYKCAKCGRHYSEAFIDKELFRSIQHIAKCFLTFPLVGGIVGFVVLGFSSCINCGPTCVGAPMSMFYSLRQFLIGLGVGLVVGLIVFIKARKD